MENVLELMAEATDPKTDSIRRKAIMNGMYADLLPVRARFPESVKWLEANKDQDISYGVAEQFLNSIYMQEALENSGAD